METVESKHKKIVGNIISRLSSNPDTQNIFLLWPNLIGITERFCNFVSPLMPSITGEPLVHHAIKLAVNAFRTENEDHLKGRAYVHGLLEAASSLSGLSVKGIKNDLVVTWEPYIEPMISWMVRNDVMIIRTSRCTEHNDESAARMALLVHILSAQDMKDMGFI